MDRRREKPVVRSSDVTVVAMAKFLSSLRIWVVIGTFLAICTLIYGLIWVMVKR